MCGCYTLYYINMQAIYTDSTLLYIVELDRKFLSVTIPETERRTQRRDPKSSYTLYIIFYQAVYTDEWGEQVIRAGKVYR